MIDDRQPATLEEVTQSIRKFGHYDRVKFLIDLMIEDQFGKPGHILRILVNQNAEEWDVETTNKRKYRGRIRLR